jgi:hypothetical protein
MLFNSSRIRSAYAVAMYRGIKAFSDLYSHMLCPVWIGFQGCKKPINKYNIYNATALILTL